MLRFWVVLFVSMALWVQPARADYYSYTEWAALPEVPQKLYMSGAFDGLLLAFAGNAGLATAIHYERCIHGAHMSNGQLTTNILNYANAKPALQVKSAANALLNYLIAACGLPPQPQTK